MTNKVRVNVTSQADAKKIRTETRNGLEKIIVPSATLPDDIVMNGIKYPAEEIAKSFATLEGTLAPFGHPEVGGMYVSAYDADGLVNSYIGAHNENVRREGGRVFIDKVIDVATANKSENGKAVINAVAEGKPINTSTGLVCELEESDEEDVDFIARNILFDHDAILLNQAPAATPEQGVGMLVNKKAIRNGEEIKVINSFLESAERQLEYAVEDTVRAIERVEKASTLERIKTVIMDAVAPERTTPATNKGEADMADNTQLEELSAKVNTIAESLDKLTEAMPTQIENAIKPLTDNLDELKANQKEKDDAELKGLQEKIVNANVMDEDGAKELTLNAARSLAEQIKPSKAAAINGAFVKSGGEEDAFLLPKGE